MAFEVSGIIDIASMISYVKNQVNEYIVSDKHHIPMNETVKSPTVTGDWSFMPIEYKSDGSGKWKQTVQQCKDCAYKVCDDFMLSQQGQIIDSSKIYNMLLQCFWTTCRIYGYSYSYYPSEDETLITKQHYGLGQMYFNTVEEYKLEIERFKEGKYKNKTILPQRIISLNDVKEEISNLISFNKSQEMYEDWGQRNDKELWYTVAQFDTGERFADNSEKEWWKQKCWMNGMLENHLNHFTIRATDYNPKGYFHVEGDGIQSANIPYKGYKTSNGDFYKLIKLSTSMTKKYIHPEFR